ncbi:VOC family protein [Streptomyces sp. NPDC012825]|uniref:VOC family protein n=1 Tax=Streptomyces sp. NPDC012825 TaxID=3364851 RepID=UPI0036C366CC
MIADFQCLVLDCPEPRALAEFYRAVLGGEVDRPDRRWSLDEDWSTLHTPGGLVLCFQGVPDLDTAHAQVLSHGATLLDAGEHGRSWRVYADPAGHPFCLVG